MKPLFAVIVVALAVGAFGLIRPAEAGIRDRIAYRSASFSDPVLEAPWHGEYYDTAWGMPVAVLVPPRPRTQTNYGWGIGGNTVTPVQAQFQRMEPPESEYHRNAFHSTPLWPSNTNQFGDYYIRGPW